jgi:hypothetical protein
MEHVDAPCRPLLRLAGVLFVLAAGCSNGDEGPSKDGSGISTAPSVSTTRSIAPPQSVDVRHRYEGPSVAFDVPDAWQEFYLHASFRFFAAYGPIEGGDADYVAVSPIPPDKQQLSPKEALTAIIPSADRIGPMRVVDVNGMLGYSASGTTGEDLEGEITIVQGQRANYLVTCQSDADWREQVVRGCESIKASLVETVPSPSTDPSGCTERELSLLHDVPFPDGSSPEEPEVVGHGTDRACDLWISMPPEYRNDVIAILSERLTEAGWHSGEATLDRTLGTSKVWRMIADRDWDLYEIEAYIDGGVTDHFFVTTVDG